MPADPAREPGPSAGRIRTVQARWLELFALFVAVPVGLLWARESGLGVPIVPVLLGMCLLVWVIRRESPPPREAVRPLRAWDWVSTIGMFLLFATSLLLLVRDTELEARADRWLVLTCYPLISVLPQEFLFRRFFFERYQVVLGSGALLVTACAAAFGLAHGVYGNATAVLISTCGGLLFAWTYWRTRSLALVVFEHTLYGGLLFAVGLGNSFRDPVAAAWVESLVSSP